MGINSLRQFMNDIGLKQKIWLTIAAVSLITVVISLGLTYFLYQKFYVDEQKELLFLQGRNLEKIYISEGEGEGFQQRLNWINNNSKAHTIYTKDPMKLSAALPYEKKLTETLITFKERQQLLNGQTVTMVRKHPMFEKDILAVAIPLKDQDELSGALFLYMPLEDVYGPFKSIRLILTAALLIILFVVVWAGRKIASQIIQPIKKMETISERMANGDFSKRIDTTSSDEVGALAKSFNRLAGSLEDVENQRKEFLQNVSHELRTPLSYMRGYTEAILEGVVDSEEERQRYLQIIHQETARLSRLVHDLLDLAQLEGDSYPMKKEPIAFAQLVADVVERFKLRIEEKNIDLNLHLNEEAIIEGDSDRLEQVVSNLLDNAIRYSEENAKINISVDLSGDEVTLSLQDTGKGIPQKDLENIMDRFYRVNKSRTRIEGGVGLGLAIVKQIILKHEGDIRIHSTPGEGTVIVLTFGPLDLDKF
ncbi:cell wall metabolism sensor histidine kinase WalK [Halobacillus salinarum]|uniref:histidine kinase n=1 Tax=Halobacillus salinarum TaxID=2932257 RepID=A0ABY4EQ68_9BACI|nr:ATP-binding protein [Halobacillus salinarum]UOQ44246.1 cell wall metabolism sensor histidine kinase WalK [Halobacillus salinarum]